MSDPAAHVAAVSAATPRPVAMHGQTIVTAILREAAEHPILFGPNGPENNRPAVHVEHALACPLEHYTLWAQRLGVTPGRWRLAHWGENLTLAGLPDENDLPIGTELRIGATAALQVIGPRVPCHKLMWRLGQPDSFITDMMRTGLVGYYLRMLEPGLIGAGDAVRIAVLPEHGITVGEVSRLLVDAGMADIPRLQAARALPAIGFQAADAIGRKLAGLIDGRRAATGRWSGWRPFRITGTREIATEIRAVTLVPEDGGPPAGFLAGQHVSVHLPGGLVRNWSLSDYDEDARCYRLSVRRQGKGSALLHHMAPGDTVALRNPAGRFTLDRSELLRSVFISAGIGITPLLAMLKAHAARADAPPLLWVHSARNGAAYAHREEVERVLARRADFASFTAFTDPARDDAGYDRHGRLDEQAIRHLLTPYPLPYLRGTVEVAGTRSIFYICGAPEFEAMVRHALIAEGVPDNAIRSEQFAPAAGAAQGPETSRIRFARAGIEAVWTSEDAPSLLELAEAAGLEPPFECRAGSCHRCETRVLDGAVAYARPPVVAPQEGCALLCCASPAGAALTLDL